MSTASLANGGTGGSVYLSSVSQSSLGSSGSDDDSASFIVERSPEPEEDYLEALLCDLDDRAAADDEHLWEAYEEATHAVGEAADGSFAPQATGSRPASAVSIQAAAAMRAVLPPPLANAKSAYALPAARRTPLTPAQSAIASELALLDLSPGSGSESARLTRSSPRTDAKFALIHPLWIAHGKASCEAAQRLIAEQIANPPAPVVPAGEVLEEFATPSATTPPSRRSGTNSRSSSRNGSRDDVGMAAAALGGKKGGLGSTQPLVVAAEVPPPRERTFAIGTALVALREARTQEALQEARRIPQSRVSAIPLLPDSEYFHLVLERQLERLGSPTDTTDEATTLATCALTWASHSLVVRTLRSPSQTGGSARTTSYLFDGQRYRVTFGEAGSQHGGAQLEDLAKADAAVWAKAREAITRDLLAPLGLPGGREGWILFWQEYVPRETCSVHLPDLRTIADGELALDEPANMPPPPPPQPQQTPLAQTRPQSGASTTRGR